MGLSNKDIRVFYSKRARAWIIANDYKLRSLMDKGYSLTKAKQESHGHVKNKKTAEKIKDNILANKKENSRSIYILECYIRVTDKTYKHHEWICGLYESKVNKGKKYYYNANRGGV